MNTGVSNNLKTFGTIKYMPTFNKKNFYEKKKCFYNFLITAIIWYEKIGQISRVIPVLKTK